MSIVKKAANNKWMIILLLILACYSFAAVYEGVEHTPIDELTGIMNEVSQQEDFAQAYQGEVFGMDMDEYRNSLSNMALLKSRYLQGPLNFFSCLLFMLVSVAAVHICLRAEEALRRCPEKSRLSQTIDLCMPALLLLAAKYFAFALYARATGQLPENIPAVAAAVSALVSCVPFLLVFISRKKQGRCLMGVSLGAVITAAANVAFQLI